MKNIVYKIPPGGAKPLVAHSLYACSNLLVGRLAGSILTRESFHRRPRRMQFIQLLGFILSCIHVTTFLLNTYLTDFSKNLVRLDTNSIK